MVSNSADRPRNHFRVVSPGGAINMEAGNSPATVSGESGQAVADAAPIEFVSLPIFCAACVAALSSGERRMDRTRRLVMTSYYEPDSRVWSPVNVRGRAMEKSPVFSGHGTQSALFRMASGCQIPDHHHSDWVQVAVISGRMRVEQDASPARIIPAGGVYFVSPGEDHVETAEVETIVLVTQPQP
jgi:quercetin dioxygenase-like cupin family protein